MNNLDNQRYIDDSLRKELLPITEEWINDILDMTEDISIIETRENKAAVRRVKIKVNELIIKLKNFKDNLS